MNFPRPRSLNRLIVAGFALVALPLLTGIVWALINLDRVAERSEQLVSMGISTADNNRRINEQLNSLERAARQHLILRNTDSFQLVTQDLRAFEAALDAISPLVEQAKAVELSAAIKADAQSIVQTLTDPGPDNSNPPGGSGPRGGVERFGQLRRDIGDLANILNAFVGSRLTALQDSARDAKQVSAWQVAALVPGTLLLILVFTLLVTRPIRQIDTAIQQLGDGGFSRPIEIKGPTDLERLGRQLDWLRVRLLELAQEKNKFLRHMSHELKTPLANIREGTELLLDGSVGDLENPQREVTNILRMNGIKLQQLIENLLSFSAWQAKSEVLTLSDFDLRKQIISVARAQRLALHAGNIQLKLEVDDVVVSADQDKIRTVLDNLLSNAIKFTPKGGVITIRAKRQTNSFVIEFGDTGPGIPVEERHRIFEAFFQGRREQGGQVDGTGIGLSVVLECIQAHDGLAELLDSDEFPGAHFRIRIPQARLIDQEVMAANG